MDDGGGSWPICVLIVDDHRMFTDVLAMRLRADPHFGRVEAAVSVPVATALANNISPDVVLLDYEVGGESGLKLIDQLGALAKRPPVVVLSGTGEPSAMIDALCAGATGWVMKDAGFDEVIVATRAALQGRFHLPAEAMRPVFAQLLREARERGPVTSFVSDLTDRQVEVLRCLVAGMTRAEVAERLYLSINTVRTHVQNMLAQLGLHSSQALVASARRAGVTGIDEVAGSDTAGAGSLT